MRTTLVLIVLSLVAIGGYAYKNNSAGCAKLASDVGMDLVAIFQTQPKPSDDSAATNTAGAPDAAPAPAPVVKPSPLQLWHPPAVLPAQPNWTWTTSDGATYQNVVVNKIEPDTAIITHSLGVAHVPMATLPPDIQKQLNYDPAAAAAAKSERERENAHPYYSFAELAEAQSAARQLNWPLAWICSDLSVLSVPSPATGSDADLTQLEMNYLKSRAVIIFLNGNEDLDKTSPVVRDQQFYRMDDGPIPGGHHFYSPKVVFTDPNITHPLGRVSHTDVISGRSAALEAVIGPIDDGMAAAR